MLEAVQFFLSLVAIVFLAWLSARLGLGGDEQIRDVAHARELADEAICGFDAREVAIGADGQSALLQDCDGRVLALKRHGGRFAACLLSADHWARWAEQKLLLHTGDIGFGAVELDLGPAATDWMTRLNRAGNQANARV